MLFEGGCHRQVTWEAFLPEDSGRLINCSFDIELDGLCLCMSNGQILLFDASEGVMEEVGEVDGGLAAASWSPSGELLVLMSGEGKMMVMNKVVHARKKRASLDRMQIPCNSTKQWVLLDHPSFVTPCICCLTNIPF